MDEQQQQMLCRRALIRANLSSVPRDCFNFDDPFNINPSNEDRQRRLDYECALDAVTSEWQAQQKSDR